MINLRSVDLNLLTVFEAVYEERSQVKAAQRLGMTQPAVSNALSRLRHLVGDRLFQGRAKGLTATGKANDLYEQLHPALDVIRNELNARDKFDPANSRRTFVIALSFGGGAGFGPQIFQRVHAEAPHVKLLIRSIDPEEEIPGLLREQRLDLAIHHAEPEDPMLEQQAFYRHELVVIARINHPRIQSAPTMEQLVNEQFVGVYDVHGLQGPPDKLKLLLALQERVLFEVPNALILPLVAKQTDLLAITTKRIAENTLTDGVVYFPLNDLNVQVLSHIIWHRSASNDPANCWLREIIMESSNLQATS